jgi:MFS family permease
MVSNPLFGHLSDRGRKRWTCLVHCFAAVLVAFFPHLPGTNHGLFFWAYMAYGFFFLASYPIVEAGVMQAVPDAVRGRAFGLWITIGGLVSNLSHWLMGHWVEQCGDRARSPDAYFALYGALAVLLVLALVGLPLLHGARHYEQHPASSSPDSEVAADRPSEIGHS